MRIPATNTGRIPSRGKNRSSEKTESCELKKEAKTMHDGEQNMPRVLCIQEGHRSSTLRRIYELNNN
jgi:hypothetical protein